MPISANITDCEGDVLLSVYFPSPALRSLAMKAVAEVYGEDGFVASSVCREPGRYEASINCCSLANAAVTYAMVRYAFEKSYGESLHDEDAVMGVTEVESHG